MFRWLLLLLGCQVAEVVGNITGTDPLPGSCICLNGTGVNVRNEACGTVVIGQANPPECYKAFGVNLECSLSDSWYEFHAVDWRNDVMGWMAGDYLIMGSDEQCSGEEPPGVCSEVEQVSRAQWGARPPAWAIDPLPSKPVGMGFVHHTVTAFCFTYDECVAQMISIQNYHIDSNGWPDIGYNWLVGEDGRAYEGRGWDTVGSHTYGYNDVAVAVSVIGDFTSRAPNAVAQSAIVNILNCAVQQEILSSTYEMFGHRDGGCTACPGDLLYALIRTWPQYSFRDIVNYCVAELDDQ